MMTTTWMTHDVYLHYEVYVSKIEDKISTPLVPRPSITVNGSFCVYYTST